MKQKAIVLAAVLCIGVMSLTACSTDGKNNNSATDDRAGSSIAPTASGDVIDDIGKDLKDGADDIGNDVKNGAEDIGNDVKKGAEDLATDAHDLTGTKEPSATGSPTMATNNANDMVTSSPK